MGAPATRGDGVGAHPGLLERMVANRLTNDARQAHRPLTQDFRR